MTISRDDNAEEMLSPPAILPVATFHCSVREVTAEESLEILFDALELPLPTSTVSLLSPPFRR